MRSQFVDPLPFSQRQLVPNGPFVEEATEGAVTHVCWMVTQGDLVATGVGHGTDPGWWADVDPDKRDWQPGPAHARAMAVTLAPEGAPQTFFWEMDLDLIRRDDLRVNGVTPDAG
jgi:hypothetical protein